MPPLRSLTELELSNPTQLQTDQMAKQAKDAPTNIFDQIDTLCAEFRRQLRAGKSASIEDYLEKVDSTARETLFRNLLNLELTSRKRNQDSPQSDEYLKRFSQFRRIIHDAFGEYTHADMASQVSTSMDEISVGDTVTFSSPAAQRIGEYELLRELGRGGMGVVYEARHATRGNRVALKTLPTGVGGQEVNAERLHRFRQEFRSLAEINHRHLIGMQTLERDASQWFLTMDLIQGTDWLSYVRPDDNLDEARLRGTLPQIASGVNWLHALRILHRDLKPSNVMVEPDGRVIILDFGLVAELQSTDETAISLGTMQFVGTPAYAAPEQVSGNASETSDWYAIGVMLYQALTGELPFTGHPLDMLQTKRLQDAPVLVGRPDCPKDLAKLVDHLLQRESTARVPKFAFEGLLQERGSDTPPPSKTRGRSASLTANALIGRELQFQKFESLHADWNKEFSTQVTFVRGRSGEGKSALVSVFLGTLEQKPQYFVLTGRCYDRESVPFKVIDSLLDPLITELRRLPREQLDSCLPRDIVFLAHLFPILRRVEAIEARTTDHRLDMDERQIRYRAFNALRSLLHALSQDRPIIVFVDDLQWGDAESVKVVRDILNHPKAPNLWFIGGYRSDEVKASEYLREWHQESEEENAYNQQLIEVGPLTVSECAEMVSSRLELGRNQCLEHAKEIHSRTQGNPYFLEQLIQSYNRHGDAFASVKLEDILEQQLQELPPQARPFLELVAVSGKALPLEDVESLLEAADSAFTTATHMRSENLIRLLGSQESPEVDTYHDKVRETVLERMPDDYRRRLHRSLGEFFEKRANLLKEDLIKTVFESRTNVESIEKGDDASSISRIPTGVLFELAFHFFEAQDSRALPYQLLAGERAMGSFAFENAIDHLERANSLIGEHHNRNLRFRVAERLGLACSRLNQSQEAFSHYERALSFAEHPVDIATAHLGIGFEHKKLGYVSKSNQSLDKALEEIEIRWPKTTTGYLLKIMSASVLAFLVPQAWQRRSATEAARYSAKASEICQAVAMTAFDKSLLLLIYNSLLCVRTAVQSGNRRLTALAYSQLSGQFAWTGNSLFVNLCQRKAAGASPLEEDKELLALQSTWKGITAASEGKHHHAIEVFDDGVQLSLDCGDEYNAGSCAIVRGHSHGIVSSCEVETAAAKQVLEIVERVGDRRAICWAEFLNAHPHARAGNLRMSHEFLRRVFEYVNEEPLVLTESIARSIQAFVLIQSSRHDLAFRHADRGWQICDLNKMHISYLVRNLPLFMEGLAGPKWNDTSREIDQRKARQLIRRSRRFQSYPLVKSTILRTRGRLLCRLGQSGKAAVCFDKALNNARRQGAKNEIARCLLDSATVVDAGQGRLRGEAIEKLREIGAVIPRAESWLLGDQYDESVVAPEFDLEAWEREHGPVSLVPEDLW